jgi:hypothetical protein
MNRMRTYFFAALFASLLVGCGRDPVAPPAAPSEPTWNLLATGETFVDVWGASPKAVFALGTASLFLYNGSSWTVLPDPPARGTAIWGTGPEDLFVVADGDVYHYDGHTWDVVLDGPTPPFYPLLDIWGSSDRDIFVAGGAGIILHYDGSVWSQMPTGFTSLCIWGTSSHDVYAAGQGSVLHYDGSTWSSLSTDPSWVLRGIWASSNLDIYCVGNDWSGDGVVLHYDGSTWRLVLGSTGVMSSVWGSSSTDVFVGGEYEDYTRDSGSASAIWHFDGGSWSQMAAGANAIWGSSSHDVFVVGGDSNNRGSLLLHYDGTEWRPQTSSPSIPLPYGWAIGGIGGSSATDIYFVGGDYRDSDAHPVIQRFDGSSFGRVVALNEDYPYTDVWATPDAVFAESSPLLVENLRGSC